MIKNFACKLLGPTYSLVRLTIISTCGTQFQNSLNVFTNNSNFLIYILLQTLKMVRLHTRFSSAVLNITIHIHNFLDHKDKIATVC